MSGSGGLMEGNQAREDEDARDSCCGEEDSSPVVERRNRSGIISAPLNKSLKHSRALSQYIATCSAAAAVANANANRLAQSSLVSTGVKAHSTAAQHRAQVGLTKLDRGALLSGLLDSPSGLHLAQAAELLRQASMLLPVSDSTGLNMSGDMEGVSASDSLGSVTDFPLLSNGGGSGRWLPIPPGPLHHDASGSLLGRRSTVPGDGARQNTSRPTARSRRPSAPTGRRSASAAACARPAGAGSTASSAAAAATARLATRSASSESARS
ncbi:hypothetical protein MHYP_G00174310 [Metynnis hypsauchen]